MLDSPEPGIINPKSLIYITPNGDNTDSIALIKRLNNDNSFYLNFMEGPIICKEAPDIIYENYFGKLKKRI